MNYRLKNFKSGQLEMRSNGAIGCFETTAQTIEESTYEVATTGSFSAIIFCTLLFKIIRNMKICSIILK